MKINSSLLTDKDISILGQVFETLVFPNDFDLIYENHVPPTGVVLIEGKLEILKRNKPKLEITTLQSFGIKELLKGTPLPFGCRIKANSKVMLISKSLVLENKLADLFNLAT
ncbi:hypothetical protein [Peredibacter starrii]|uniref:Cyclic nucleotide-binding domain-containing protein n=1 Tax=Peredibacter starrii TaxID=28202 RepID=A0AAX4HKY8_9BACT|nr:hypothetical protein [Peredibacter starrii]WPU63925.1 hypothetical protein SOO65_14615 [Peredibacter starrii]